MKRRKPQNQAEEEFIAEQRKLVLALAIMGFIFLVTFLIIRLSWSLQKRRLDHTGKSIGRPLESINDILEPGITSDVTLPPDVQMQNLKEIATLHSEQKKFDEAIEAYKKILDFDRQDFDTWVQMGRLYLAADDPFRAESAFEQALRLDENAREIQVELASAYMRQDHFNKALSILEEVLLAGDEFPRAYLLHAICMKAQGRPGESEESLNAYLALRPDDPLALKELAFIEASQTQYESALAHIEKALDSAPDWPTLYLDAAAICALMSRDEEALDYLRTALSLSSPAIVYHTFRQPAFQNIRQSEAGTAFEREVVQAANDSSRTGTAPSRLQTNLLDAASVELVIP